MSDQTQTVQEQSGSAKPAGTSKAGSHFAGSVTAGTCVRIFTGAVVPLGADVIALQEDATEQDDAVTIEEVPKPGQFIRPMAWTLGRDSNASRGGACLRRAIWG
jgi:molybdopterin molybdotransferase